MTRRRRRRRRRRRQVAGERGRICFAASGNRLQELV
jgi:hypothetical protein